jgi:hypothetical protein
MRMFLSKAEVDLIDRALLYWADRLHNAPSSDSMSRQSAGILVSARIADLRIKLNKE